MAVEARLAEFRGDLPRMDSITILRKYVYVGASLVLSDEQHSALKTEVADHFGIHVNEVVMVGSAKLGFSIKPTRRYGLFSDDSDIDLALVDRTLFEELWKDVYEYNRNGGLWPGLDEFKRYHFQGWIRPDKLPPEDRFARAADWWEFFRTLTASQRYGPYRVKAGLYHSWSFLESYQQICINQCKEIG